MTWTDWLFWRKHCKLCGETYKNGGAILWLQSKDGPTKLKICPVCSGMLEAQRKSLLNMKVVPDEEPPPSK